MDSRAKIKAIAFWVIIASSIAGLWYTSRLSRPGELGRVAALIIPTVVLSSWFERRFSGRRKWTARIAVWLVLVAMVAGAAAAWEFTLLKMGYNTQGNLLEGSLLAALFIGLIAAAICLFVSLGRSSPA